MSALAEILEKLQDTQKTIVQLERAAAEHPASTSLGLTLSSLQKRQVDLEKAFAEEAHKQELDVCSYRLFSDSGNRPTVLALSGVLADFQSWFTSVFDAIKNGPKQRSRVEPDVALASSFEFGYSFAGSVGIVMTMPNERLLLDETQLDEAMRTVFKMAKADDSEKVAYFSKTLGSAVVRKMYRWAADHVASRLGADIEWRRQENVKASLFIQLPELDSLRQAIEETSDEVEEVLTLSGTLVGADTAKHTFHMTFDGADDIRGTMSEAIGGAATVELPKHYTAKIRKTTKINYATDKEEIDYHLLELT